MLSGMKRICANWQQRNLNPVILPILGGKPDGKLTVPLDNARASLFDTAYVHPILRDHAALWTFYDVYVRSILWLNTGTPGGLDQIVGEPSPEKNHVSKSKWLDSIPQASQDGRCLIDGERD
jgi:dimethylaniline monooxygenase (N-oxide forming)